jgi:DNA-binding NtrC family response regulator
MSDSGVNRTILHIDDDPQFTLWVQRLLSRKGYDVVSLNDPTQALDEIMRQGYRIVLLDIDMPGIDGIELLRRIKEYDGGIQVVMLTGLVTLGNAMTAFRRGAEAFFFKPVEDLDALTASLDAVVRKIEHWWGALHNLTTKRRQFEAANKAAAVVNSAIGATAIPPLPEITVTSGGVIEGV